MPPLQDLIRLGLTVSLAGLGVALGLESTPAELLRLFRRPWDLAKALLAADVIVPAAAMAVISVLPLPSVVKIGVVLMSVSPPAPLAPGKLRKASGQRRYSYGLFAALVLVSAVTVPVTVAILSRVYRVEVALPPLAILRKTMTELVVPVGAGLALRRLLPRLAERAGPLIDRGATLLLALSALPLILATLPQTLALVGSGTVFGIVLMLLAALAGGHLLGGPSDKDRAALGMAAATRHPGVALLIAGAAHADRRVTAAILAVLLVGMAVTALYQAWLDRPSRK